MTGLVTSSQVQLFPPAYMLHRFNSADALIILEEAQYTKKQFFDHFRVGEREINFKVPLNGGSSRRPLDSITFVDLTAWLGEVERKLPSLYPHTPEFKAGYKWLMGLLEDCQNYTLLQNLCMHTLEATFEALGITTPIKYSRVLVPCRPEDPSQWLAELTKRAGAHRYYQGRDAMDAYFDPEPFDRKGIELYCQQWHPPQMMKPHIGMQKSILHSIFVQGFEKTAEGLKGHGVVPWPVQGE